VLADHLPSPVPDVPWVVVSADPEVVEAAGARGHLAPDGAGAARVAFVPPFVRERLRAARRLPERAVLAVGADGDAVWDGRLPVPADALDTALACAAVASIAPPELLSRALAWGTPTTIPAATADALGLGVAQREGPDAVVAVEEDPDVLAADVRRLARLGWRGRRWWEIRHDPAPLAARLAVDLLPSTPLAARVRLAELGTPAGAHVRDRLREAGG
jgi:hypothetical protein